MRTSRSMDELEPAPGGAVVSIGVFDGVHLGHAAILEANVNRARELGAQPTVVTFQRHPKELLVGRAPRTLTTLEHRLELFGRCGIEHAVALDFDEELRSLSPAEFVERVCVRGLGVRRFVLGFDSKFGKDRAGTPEWLRGAGFEVEVAPKVVIAERAVSSTAIREAVELGELERAAQMLGRPVSVFGEVVQGRQLGRTLGFPTANLDLHHELSPPTGVYATWARRLASDERLPSVTNVGFRPTVEDTRPEFPTVEVHLLDFTGQLYGEVFELEFVTRLRPEKRFESFEELKAQIARDAAEARRRLL